MSDCFIYNRYIYISRPLARHEFFIIHLINSNWLLNYPFLCVYCMNRVRIILFDRGCACDSGALSNIYYPPPASPRNRVGENTARYARRVARFGISPRLPTEEKPGKIGEKVTVLRTRRRVRRDPSRISARILRGACGARDCFHPRIV